MNPRHQRSPKNLTIYDVYPPADPPAPPEPYRVDGVFTKLTNTWDSCPWKNEDGGLVNSIEFVNGIDYGYYDRSGNKFVSPFVYRMRGMALPYGSRALTTSLVAKFGAKWIHLWNLYKMQYSPLDSYNMQEIYERDATTELDTSSTRTPNLTDAKTGTDNLAKSNTHTPDVTETKTGTDNLALSNSETVELEHGHVVTEGGDEDTTTTYGKSVVDSGNPADVTTGQTKGFNSQEWADLNKESQQHTTDNTQVSSGSDSVKVDFGKTETHSGTDTTGTTGSGSENRTLNITERKTGTESDSGSENRTLNLSETHTGTETTLGANDETEHEEYSSTKRGTMYRAPAELMSLDRDFWLTEYFSIVYADVDSMLTLAVYSERDPIEKVY